MQKTLSSTNLYDQNFNVFEFDGVYRDVFGTPTTGGCWLIYGKEKNGKTWAALLLANMLRRFKKSLYISGEEGTDRDFVEACKRAQIPPRCKGLNFLPYQTMGEIQERLKNHRVRPGIIFIDNATVYADVMKPKDFQKLLTDYPNVLFIMLAHEERGEPATALARYVKKMAKRIIRVKGLACEVSGRGPGGTLVIDPEKSALFHGNKILTA